MQTESNRQEGSSIDGNTAYQFGQWRFFADLGELYDGETTTRLEPQVAKLLEHFLTHQHKVISRDELIAAVWDKRTVSDDAINRCVSILRQTLSPEDKNAFIETVVRKGYIAHFPVSPGAESPAESSFGLHKYLKLAALAGLVIVVIYLIAKPGGDSAGLVSETTRSGPPMVAVLPFESASREGDDEFFANGVHNDLLTQLAKLQFMRVISATSVQEYRGKEHNLRRIGEDLGADVILEGNVQTATNGIRINAQLIDAKTDEHLWAESYDRELSPSNIFDVQSEIARSIAEAMNATLTAQDAQQLALIPTENMAAYRAYHRAMQLLELPGVIPSSPEFIQAMEEAVELDPDFSRAWAELVSGLAFANFDGTEPEMTLRAEQALERLQAVAPGSADLLIAQAAYVYYALKDYNRAHDILSQALIMTPGDASAVQLRSWIERRQGDFDAFLASRREASQLDPRNANLMDALLGGLLLMHQYDEAREELDKTSLESFSIGYYRRYLSFRQNRDANRFQESMQELCAQYEEPACGWDAYIANRNYPGALAILDEDANRSRQLGIEAANRYRIFTLWLMDEQALLMQGLPDWQRQLGLKDAGGTQTHVESALLSGIQGNLEGVEKSFQLWNRQDDMDWAERITLRHHICRILGMIGATPAAVQCVRDGLEEPSYIDPLVEPYLPFYDSIREEPEFSEMLLDIDAEKGA